MTRFTIGQYEIQGKPREGGYAYVYRAWDRNKRLYVAIKVLKKSEKQSNGFSPAAIERFVRETRALIDLSNQPEATNIVKTFNYGNWEKFNAPFIVMEYISDGSLRDLLRKKKDEKLCWHEASRIMLGVARGAQLAHQNGIIHRDIKPENILLDGDTPKLADFGILLFVPHSIQGQGMTKLTRGGSLLGTPGYNSPEIEQGNADKIGAGSDVYSLGVVLFELLTGELPPPESSVYDTPKQDKIETSLRDVGSPEELTQVILECLQKEPKDRFPSGKELGDALEQIVSNLRHDLTCNQSTNSPDSLLPSCHFAPTTSDRGNPSAIPTAKKSLASRRWLYTPKITKIVLAFGVVSVLTMAIFLVTLPYFLTARKPQTKVDPTPSGGQHTEFVSLFNGNDLTGWDKTGNPMHLWQVVDGVIIGEGPPTASSLKFQRDFNNFHLRIEAMLSEGNNSCIHFRNGKKGTYGVHINGTKDSSGRQTGQLVFWTENLTPGTTLAEAKPVVPLKANKWFTVEIIAVDTKITVIVEGHSVVEFQDREHALPSGGCISLACRGDSKVRFRRIEIKELPRVASKRPWWIEEENLVSGSQEGFRSLFSNHEWKNYAFFFTVRKVFAQDGVIGNTASDQQARPIEGCCRFEHDSDLAGGRLPGAF